VNDHVFDVADYNRAKKSVFITASVLFALKSAELDEVPPGAAQDTLALLKAVGDPSLSIVVGVLCIAMVIRSFEVSMPVNKIVTEFFVGYMGAILFAIVAVFYAG